MEGQNIYDTIAERTGGDIYVGVVGPVRTGKSTFIKRFMDTLVIPHIESAYMKDRANDKSFYWDMKETPSACFGAAGWPCSAFVSICWNFRAAVFSGR